MGAGDVEEAATQAGAEWVRAGTAGHALEGRPPQPRAARSWGIPSVRPPARLPVRLPLLHYLTRTSRVKARQRYNRASQKKNCQRCCFFVFFFCDTAEAGLLDGKNKEKQGMMARYSSSPSARRDLRGGRAGGCELKGGCSACRAGLHKKSPLPPARAHPHARTNTLTHSTLTCARRRALCQFPPRSPITVSVAGGSV